jgi:predicted RNA methylase
MEQKHLDHKDTVNLGSYYTPPWLVDIVYSLIEKNVSNFSDYNILDTSCGYGGFLRGQKAIGADIDSAAVEMAKTNVPASKYFTHNSLFEISRSQYGLDKAAKVIIVGNPPYNDTTSIIRSNIKKQEFMRDAEVMSRDLGISFLLSYDKLAADYVCVLHPLSYLIKKANFDSLMSFKNDYLLLDSVVVSSSVFSATSKTTSFPIIVALYERNLFGMDYNYIENYKFKTNEDKTFSLRQYDTIGKYINKYPNKNKVSANDTVAYFYTMRDINALKRTATFLDNETCYQNKNAVRITADKMPYYCYVDVFKEYIPHIPYYFGNSDIMINNEAFTEMKDVFVSKSLKKHPGLSGYIKAKKTYSDIEKPVQTYFKNLLGEHYVD